MKCVILAGGLGNTLWPLSRKNYPKQFLNICEGRSLLQDTIVRNMPFADEFIIVTNESYADIMETQLKVFQDVRYRIIYESKNCGTFAAVSLASIFLNPSDLMMVTVSDLVIESGSYKDSIIRAKEAAQTGTIANIVSSVNGEHAGIYVCMVGAFNKALRGIYPDIAQTKKAIRRKLKTVSHIINVPDSIMNRFPKMRMQADLFTKIDNITELTADFEYRDIDCIADINDEDNQSDYGHRNIIDNACEDVVMINTADKHLIVANHINNISIVNTEDATYISDREHISLIKDIVKSHVEEYKPYFDSSKVSFREWGMHQILCMTKNYKVKKVTLYPGMSMKMHCHEHRSESWMVVDGIATIQIGDNVAEYGRGATVSIPVGMPHKVSNHGTENVVIIETGIGEIMSESDFLRIEPVQESHKIPDIIRLEPAFKDYLWGGTKLRTVFGKKCDYDIIAESWELSAHPDGQSIIADGPYKGMYFGEFIEKFGADTVGWKSGSLDRFPILIKFIDAMKPLSIQIHPDDEYALGNENEFGKNEMWYVMDAVEGAYLYCGLSKDASKEEIRERIENNTITDILNKVEVSKGDCVMVKAGTIHAIGAGILICEIQQNSNCTYRMYDYDRRDKFGNKRELHVDKALDVVDTKKYVSYESCENTDDKALEEAAITLEEDSTAGQLLVSCKYFECYKYDISDHVTINVDTASFRSVIFTEGKGTIRVDDNIKNYKAGDSFFITAGNKTVDIEGDGVAIVTNV